MNLSEEERQSYERKFHAYILKTIKNSYIRFQKKESKIKAELILNDFENDKTRYIKGDNDVFFIESFAPEELELICEDKRVFYAIKPLTYKEKLVVFLCVIMEKKASKVTKIMGYSSVSSVTRLLKKAIKKIRNNLKNIQLTLIDVLNGIEKFKNITNQGDDLKVQIEIDKE